MQHMSATPEEVLAVVSELYPAQYDRAVAELTIRKQAERIAFLENALSHAESEHPHTHAED
jgi:hypothetical protein